MGCYGRVQRVILQIHRQPSQCSQHIYIESFAVSLSAVRRELGFYLNEGRFAASSSFMR